MQESLASFVPAGTCSGVAPLDVVVEPCGRLLPDATASAAGEAAAAPSLARAGTCVAVAIRHGDCRDSPRRRDGAARSARPPTGPKTTVATDRGKGYAAVPLSVATAGPPVGHDARRATRGAMRRDASRRLCVRRRHRPAAGVVGPRCGDRGRRCSNRPMRRGQTEAPRRRAPLARAVLAAQRPRKADDNGSTRPCRRYAAAGSQPRAGASGNGGSATRRSPRARPQARAPTVVLP